MSASRATVLVSTFALTKGTTIMASITIAADHNTGAIPTRLTFSQEKAMSSARASQMALRGAIDLSQTARTMQMLANR